MTTRIIDVETTGLDPARDAIVEIASVDAQRDGRPANPQSHLVNPCRDIPALASAVHHITIEMVRDKPPIGDVVGSYAGADLYVAHNIDLERGFLDPHFGPDVDWLCTYKCALRLWPDYPSHSNQALRYLLGHAHPFGMVPDDIGPPHRALPDCYVTAAIFGSVVAEAKTQGVKLTTLVEWSCELPLMTRFKFGKHKGERLDAVPREYLEWIVERSDMTSDVKFSAAYWMAQAA